MTLQNRIDLYLEKVPAATSGEGGHDATYHIACELVHGFGLSHPDALAHLSNWNRGCSPPWSEKELEHKINCAENAKHKNKRGWRVGGGGGSRGDFEPSKTPKIKGHIVPKTFEEQLPEPIPNGTIRLLQLAFKAGEGVGIVEAVEGADGRSMPKGGGLVMSRESWLARFGEESGEANKVFGETPAGGFIRINPMALNGTKDDDVSVFRHALLEFDSCPILDQWQIIKSSDVPCSAVIYSGGKSLHAWVKVDAENRIEYATRVSELLEHFAQYVPDPKNRNPSRLSRLAGLSRGKKVQDLLAENIGAKSWGAWRAGLAVSGSGVMRVRDLLQVVTDPDPNTVVGNRWLCRGHTCLIVGPSGVGKSTLTMQLAVNWAIGLPVFGVKPVKPLKSLVIQAENDAGDLAEQLRATQNQLGRYDTPEVMDVLNSNLIFVREMIATGFEFCAKLQNLIDEHKPDVVWVDPLLSYIGDDISDQKVASTFLRNWLAPILESTEIVLILVHHIRKPTKDDALKTGLELQYLAAGSAEVVNFSRAVIYLESSGDGLGNLHFTKRGKRAGALDFRNNPATKLAIRHSTSGPTWEICAEDESREMRPNKNPGADEVRRVLGSKWLSYRGLIDGLVKVTGCTSAAAVEAFTDAKSCLEIDGDSVPKLYRWRTAGGKF